MKPLTVLLTPEQRAELERRAAAEGRSLGNALRRLLTKALETPEGRLETARAVDREQR